MTLYGGIDLHSNNSVVSLLDEKDRVVYEHRLPNKLSTILRALAPYRDRLHALVVESTYNWYWLVDGLQEAGYDVRLANTAAIKMYDGMKYTDDEHDARHLAHLLRLRILPEGYIYPKEQRGVRDLLRRRSQLVRQRTMQILSIKNLWSRNTGVSISKEAIEQGKSSLEGAEANQALAIESTQVVFNCLDKQIQNLEHAILKQVRHRRDWERLLTLPGVGKILGLTILLETGDISRFRKAGQYASYCRCVSSRNISNGKKKGSGNRKNGNRYLGWAFVEAANFAIRYHDRIKGFAQRKERKTKKVIARKAVAHKLSKACYYILRDQVPFDMEKAFA